jgi:uncharacterized protein
VDFTRVVRIFEGPTLEAQDRREYGEARIGAFGETGGDVFFVVYTWRGAIRRIISARKAGSNERNLYRAAVSHSHAKH